MHESVLVPMVNVTADFEGRDLGSVSDDVAAIGLAGSPLPPGVRVVRGGQIEGERATRRELLARAAVAFLLVVTVLAGQFRRLRLAALVTASIPMAIVGALLALAHDSERRSMRRLSWDASWLRRPRREETECCSSKARSALLTREADRTTPSPGRATAGFVRCS